MSWRVAAASVSGISHKASGQPCQDAYKVIRFNTHEGPEILGIFVADGAGSARFGREGATATVEAAASFWEDHLRHSVLKANAAVLGLFLLAVRSRLVSLAAKLDTSVRECACTFLNVLTFPDGVVTVKVGDGAIVLDLGDGYEVASKPMSGEYANTTWFITDPEENLHGEGIVYEVPAMRVAVFTDGLQRLALDAMLLQANPIFFGRRFATLKAALPEQEEQLNPALKAWLASEGINRHSGDDKTLVLALLREE